MAMQEMAKIYRSQKKEKDRKLLFRILKKFVRNFRKKMRINEVVNEVKEFPIKNPSMQCIRMVINRDKELDEEVLNEDAIRPSNLVVGTKVKTKMIKINIVHSLKNS